MVCIMVLGDGVYGSNDIGVCYGCLFGVYSEYGVVR